MMFAPSSRCPAYKPVSRLDLMIICWMSWLVKCWMKWWQGTAGMQEKLSEPYIQALHCETLNWKDRTAKSELVVSTWESCLFVGPFFFYHLGLSENGGSPQIHWLIIIVPLRWAMEISVASRCPGCSKPWFEDGNTQVFLLLPFWIRRTGGLSFPVFPVRISIGINVEASAPKPPGKSLQAAIGRFGSGINRLFPSSQAIWKVWKGPYLHLRPSWFLGIRNQIPSERVYHLSPLPLEAELRTWNKSQSQRVETNQAV